MKAICIIILSNAAIYLPLMVGVTLLQRSLLYFPGIGPVSPKAAGLPTAQALRIETADGETLVAWHIPAEAGKPLLPYFRGNAGGLVERVPRFALLTAHGNGLLAIAYRGYFGSTGRPSEAGLRADADAAYGEALRLGYDASRIVAVGESLGTGVAVPLAARKPVAAVILDSPFTSTVYIAAARLWMLPVRYLMWDRFMSSQSVGKIHVPILMAHGTGDTIVPIRFGSELFAAANEPKRFIEVPNAGHLVLGLPEIMPKVLRWIDANVPGRPE